MRKCLIHLVIVLQIGGGFLGVWILVSQMMRNANVSGNTWIVNIPPIIIFLFGIAAGLALAEGLRLGLILSAVYQALHVPALLSPLLCYKLHSGLLVGLAWSQDGIGPWIEFGSAFGIRLFGYKGSWRGISLEPSP